MKKIIKLLIILLVVAITINIYVVLRTKKQIITIEDTDLKDIDCILVLGASIRNNKPSPMLEDRLKTSMEIFNNKITDRILVSGDHTEDNYDEVNVMKNYLIENNIPSEKIFMDHAGISSYDSIYRAKKIYKANRIIIVTQKYHLYRSLYIAKKLDIEAYGVVADKREYQNQSKRDIREFLARIKDFFKCIYKPTSNYLGEVHPISGNGDDTNSKKI